MRPLMNQQGTDRPRTAGFTMVELLVAITIGSILMIAIYQVLVTNQRVSAVQTEQILTQQTMRAGVDLLAQELREVSVRDPVAGQLDLLTVDDQRVEFRALRAFGIVCNSAGDEDPDDGLGSQLVVNVIGGSFAGAPPPPVYVFAEGERHTAGDDRWVPLNLVDLPVTDTCPAGQPARRLVITSPPSGTPAIRTGAAIRAFHTVEYHLDTIDGEVYLVRTQDGNTVRLVGPLDPDDPLEFVYLDQNGNSTNNPAQVRRVQITLRASSDIIRTSGAGGVGGELSTTVFLRN